MDIVHYYLIDTSFWVDFFYPLHALSLVQRHKTNEIIELLNTPMAVPSINGIILAEILRGLAPNKKNKQRIEYIQKLKYLEITKDICHKAAEIAYMLDRVGQTIGLPDCIIAATALVYNTTLITKDTHFKRIDNLKLLILS